MVHAWLFLDCCRLAEVHLWHKMPKTRKGQGPCGDQDHFLYIDCIVQTCIMKYTFFAAVFCIYTFFLYIQNTKKSVFYHLWTQYEYEAITGGRSKEGPQRR